MLVLSRRENEAVMIGNDIEVMVVAVDGNCVQLGFNAPRGVPIARTELLKTGPFRKTSEIPVRHFNNDEPLEH